MKRILPAIIFIVLVSLLDYSYALTPEQVVKLRKAGVSDRTIQLMLKQESEAQGRNPADQIGTREVRDQHGNAYVIYSTGAGTVDQEEKEKLERAWKMLENMTVIEKDTHKRRRPAQKE